MVNLTYNIRSLKNEGFEAGTRKLLVEAGASQLIVVLWNRQAGLFDGAEVFTGIEDWNIAWSVMLQQSSLLNFRHLETEVFINSERFLPTPAIFYEPDTAAEQIGHFFGEIAGHYVGGDVHSDEGMVIAWQGNMQVYETLRGHFQMFQAHSLASLLLKTGRFTASPGINGNMIVSGGNSWFSIWRGESLLFIRSISVKDPDNLAYFMLNACKNWGIEPASIQWQVAGFIEIDSPLWLATERFFPHFKPMEGQPLGGDMPDHFMAHFLRYLGQ